VISLDTLDKYDVLAVVTAFGWDLGVHFVVEYDFFTSNLSASLLVKMSLLGDEVSYCDACFDENVVVSLGEYFCVGGDVEDPQEMVDR
jgi:hypothetical protein